VRAVVYGVVGLIFTTIAVILIVESRAGSGTRQGSVSVPNFQTGTVRRVAFTEEPVVSRGQHPMWVQLQHGTIPAEVKQPHFLTAEDCTPDAEGVSHWLNRVRFQSASSWGSASIRHHHRMSEESCLAPGEIVEVVARAMVWIPGSRDDDSAPRRSARVCE
jgi:hypothetical protein